MWQKRKYIGGAVVICIALGFLLFTGLNSCSVYYYTVGELLEKGETKFGENVRVSGTIVGNSIAYDPGKPELRFAITDETASLHVIYLGERPHTFDEDKDIVVEGELNSDGIFQADKLVMKCASKYESED